MFLVDCQVSAKLLPKVEQMLAIGEVQSVIYREDPQSFAARWRRSEADTSAGFWASWCFGLAG